MNAPLPRRPPGIGHSSNARLRRRRVNDALTRIGIGLGGITVIAAVVLIFVYLLWVVWPLFGVAEVAGEQSFSASSRPADGPLYLTVEEGNQAAVAVNGAGDVLFFSTRDGAELSRHQVPLPANTHIRHIAEAPGWGQLALGLSDGRILLLDLALAVDYPDGRRNPRLELVFPFGDSAYALFPGMRGADISALAYTRNEQERSLIAAEDAAGGVSLLALSARPRFLTGESEVRLTRGRIEASQAKLAGLALSADQRWLYRVQVNGTTWVYDVSEPGMPSDQGRIELLPPGAQATAVGMLGGGISLLVGDSRGITQQLFPVRAPDGQTQFPVIRSFAVSGQPVTHLLAERRRKGFVTIDGSGVAHWFHTTADRHVMSWPVGGDLPRAAALSPRADRLLLASDDGLRVLTIDNPHPEVSLGNLWVPVWYENYTGPRWVWQSSAGNDDVEPKLSLTPLAFGTLKAAFYAMLFAVPLALAAAVYTANFMAPRMRRSVKPTIEVIEALPTVILGFLAGLWLAPYVERNLAAVINLFLMMPVGILLFAMCWSRAPQNLRRLVPQGWHAALLIPVVIAIGAIAVGLGTPIENTFFEGSLSNWLSEEAGITYDQRNALVVGVAMGFAVVPTIYSISEDALHGVPGSLVRGSLALGATRWQTLLRVVLPTASPGIFSALMIGLGRAIGETMIVLMATGNTPIMDMNLFEGMRSLSANIAVELPESELNSTHYRVLFLSALVLFVFTFVVNTGADIVRQRLRKRYAAI